MFSLISRLSRLISILRRTAWWLSRTALGRPVLPEDKIRTASSSGATAGCFQVWEIGSPLGLASFLTGEPLGSTHEAKREPVHSTRQTRVEILASPIFRKRLG